MSDDRLDEIMSIALTYLPIDCDELYEGCLSSLQAHDGAQRVLATLSGRGYEIIESAAVERLRVADTILRKLAAMDPWEEISLGRRMCRLCWGFEHADDCVWAAAAALQEPQQ